MPTCRSCNKKINRKTAYKNRKRGRGYHLICKECHNKLSYERKLKNRTKNKPIQLKAINRANPIIFSTYAEKREFLLLRRQQSIGARPAIGHSSRVGQRVEQVIEERDKDTKEVHRYQMESRCSECQGIIRYDDRGFKVCESCGLLAELFTLSNELGADSLLNDLPAHEYYSHARQGSSEGAA